MRNFLAGILGGLLLALLLCASCLWIVPWWLERPPSVAKGTTLVLRLSGTIYEQEPPTLYPFAGERPWTTLRLWETLRKAAADPRIAALLLFPEKPAAGWAKLAEIRNSLLLFRKTGKPVVAYLRSATARDYYLATAAGRLAAPPGDLVDLKGLRAELTYGRLALDKLGILPEFESMGRYKDGADILTRSSSTPETRQVINNLLDSRLESLISAISQSRGRTPQQVRQLLDEGPFLAASALASGLIDAAQYEDQARSELAAALHQKELATLPAADYQRVRPPAPGLDGKQKIAFVAAQGDILRSPIPFFDDQVLDPESFAATLKKVREDDSIKAVILRIDSPGGDAIASDEMTREVKRLAAVKPVIVSMADVAASGGYALAMGAPTVVAYPETITGSIGVFFGKLTLTGLYDKLGIRKEIYTRGRFAAIDSDAQPLSNDGRRKLHESLEAVYADFVRQVAASRKKKYDEIDRIAQGRVWLGSEAKANGLVDDLGGIERAIYLARQRASISPQHQIRLVVFPSSPDWIHSLVQRLAPFLRSTPLLRLSSGVWKRIPVGLAVN
ncbi:MAG: signal peptide peptidase SppA [Bryobacterales bacterium]|nr:signal peptide peptidase SppA [Bryobacterales bacterium]